MKNLKGLLMATVCVTNLFLGLSPALASVQDRYLDYLKLKVKILSENIHSKDQMRFVPHDVLWEEKVGALIVPRQNPYIKVFDPDNSEADSLGMIQMPNVSVEKEKQELRQAQEELERLQKKRNDRYN